MEPKSIVSLNGARVTDTLFQITHDLPRFRLVLRFVKHWAKRRGIYSNVLGFLGGISWEILVAYVSNLHPTVSSPMLLCLVWKHFHEWTWPTPVYLQQPLLVPDEHGFVDTWQPSVPFLLSLSALLFLSARSADYGNVGDGTHAHYDPLLPLEQFQLQRLGNHSRHVLPLVFLLHRSSSLTEMGGGGGGC